MCLIKCRFRLISQGSIEEGMLAMCKEKLKLEREITTEGIIYFELTEFFGYLRCVY